MSAKNILRTLENGVRFGKWVLMENVGESLDAALEPILQKNALFVPIIIYTYLALHSPDS